jgi:hypothetical protein
MPYHRAIKTSLRFARKNAFFVGPQYGFDKENHSVLVGYLWNCCGCDSTLLMKPNVFNEEEK